MNTVQRRSLSIERVTIPDHTAIRALLDFLPVLYPGGDLWLRHRLDDVANGEALCFTAMADDELVGVSIGTPKRSGRFKVSTLFVEPSARGKGIGSALLTAVIASEEASVASQVYLTGAETIREQLQPMLSGHGFRLIATEVDRYGEGRSEDVYAR